MAWAKSLAVALRKYDGDMSEDTTKSPVELLRVPFPQSVIKERKGARGMSLSYVEGAEYVRRMLDALGLEWSFEVREWKVVDGEAMVLGRLTVGTTVREQFGGQQVRNANGDLMMETTGDALKAAATDAFKKCASLVGLGLHLWLPDPEPEPVQKAQGRPQNGAGQAQSSQARQGGGQQSTSSTGQGGAMATERQVQAIRRMGLGHFSSPHALEKWALEKFGAIPEKLTRADASKCIDALNEMIR